MLKMYKLYILIAAEKSKTFIEVARGTPLVTNWIRISKNNVLACGILQ